MDIQMPTGCGNSPRIDIIADFTSEWASGNSAAVAEMLADNVVWNVVGKEVHSGTEEAQNAIPTFSPQRLEIKAIVTHGRYASCDGSLEAGSQSLQFNHVFRFTSTSKTAKIAEIRSYLIESST